MLCCVYSLQVTSVILKHGLVWLRPLRTQYWSFFFLKLPRLWWGKKEESAFYKFLHKLLSTTWRCAMFTLDGFLEFLSIFSESSTGITKWLQFTWYVKATFWTRFEFLLIFSFSKIQKLNWKPQHICIL